MQTAPDRKQGALNLDLERVVRDHYDAVYRFCARRVGPDRAGDCAQETFLTAQRVIGKFRGESTISTWLFGIALNECRRMARKYRIECCSLELDVPESGSPKEQILVDRQALRQALDRLSEEHREAVLLHEVEGMTYEEAAEVLGIPVGTVKSRLHHAFIQLRRSLFPMEVEA